MGDFNIENSIKNHFSLLFVPSSKGDGMENKMQIPKHIAIIMDGNGRFAQKMGKDRSFGHIEGAKRVEPICKYCDEIGIEYLTLYAFSTENYKRPKTEVSTIMSLFNQYLVKFIKPMLDNNMRFAVIGNREGMSKKLLGNIQRLEEETKYNTGLQLTLAINYGGHDEIIRAVNSINKTKISAEDLTAALDTGTMPNPDLIIRTGGEKRISNFLIWQSAYSELYFCDKYWPEFFNEDLKTAIDDYCSRDRRFGGV